MGIFMTQDLRFALRMIRSHPWFSAAIVATLAIGIGINTMVFTLVNAVLYKPLPFRGGDRIVAIRNNNQAKGQDGFPVSYPDYLDYRAQSTSFETLEASRNEPGAISEQGNPPEQYVMARVTAGFFDMLGVQPMLGRGLTAKDAAAGAEPVLLISYTVWRDRYAQSRDVIGRTVRLNQQQATIVGVMPEGFGFPNMHQAWAPLVPAAPQFADRGARNLLMIGVRKPGVTMQQAQADLGVIARRLAAEYPLNKDVGIRMQTFHELQNSGPIRTVFLLMLGAVGFVLLIACANVANMMLSRALGRKREISIRAAMGASRWRIIRQLLVESTVLSFLGGSIGLILSRYGVRAFDFAVRDAGKPSWILFTMDYAAFGYFAGICLLSGLLFGLAPGLRASRVDLNDALKDGGRTAGSQREGWLSGALVVFQFTLAVVLLAGAGLFIRGVLAQRAIAGERPLEEVMTARVNLPGDRYRDNDARTRFFDQLLPGAASLPGVRQAALVSSGPGEGGENIRFQIEGQPDVPNEQRLSALRVAATPSYFGLIDLPIIAGRGLDEMDGSSGRESVIVTADFASRHFANQSPLGKRIRIFTGNPPAGQWHTIVGVSGNLVQQLQEQRPDAVLFGPYRGTGGGFMTVMLRTSGDPASLTSALRTEVQRLDPDLALSNVMTLEERSERQAFLIRVFGSIFAVFALAALLMASVGIYAVVSHATGRRTQEIGVRLALGASYLGILRLVLARGMIQLLAGLVLGLGAAFGLTRLMSSLLFNVSPRDPLVFTTATLVLAVIGLLACWLPARRAARLHPVKALRYE
jgi:putative ABC transport system permease protein